MAEAPLQLWSGPVVAFIVVIEAEIGWRLLPRSLWRQVRNAQFQTETLPKGLWRGCSRKGASSPMHNCHGASLTVTRRSDWLAQGTCE
jgi:hypothetical protein